MKLFNPERLVMKTRMLSVIKAIWLQKLKRRLTMNVLSVGRDSNRKVTKEDMRRGFI